MWTAEQKRHAAVRAPIGREVRRDDTEFIERPGWSQIITRSMPPGNSYLNEVTLSQVAPEDADRVIDEVVAMYRAGKHPVKWYVGPWTKPDDFGERLVKKGFTFWDVLCMGIATDAVIPPSPIEVREVTRAELPAYTDCSLRGWGMDVAQAPLEIASHARAMGSGAHFFAAWIDGEIVGTAGIFPRAASAESPGFGYLVGTQVLERARGRGAYRALVAARLACLAELGLTYAVSHARASSSAPILERLGFETILPARCYFLA